MNEPETIRKIYDMKTIAVVGAGFWKVGNLEGWTFWAVSFTRLPLGFPGGEEVLGDEPDDAAAEDDQQDDDLEPVAVPGHQVVAPLSGISSSSFERLFLMSVSAWRLRRL